MKEILISLGSAIALNIVFSVISACSYDSKAMDDAMSCVTTNVTFSGTIKPILDANCIVCHSAADPADGLNFESFEGVTEVARNGRLIGSIKHLSGYAPMPEFAPMLPACDIMQIEKWIQDGVQNN